MSSSDIYFNFISYVPDLIGSASNAKQENKKCYAIPDLRKSNNKNFIIPAFNGILISYQSPFVTPKPLALATLNFSGA